MVGPSSSHTAGACRIANLARKICGFDFKKVSFFLHGSFAYTYKGHGTDKALLGGIMGFSTYDPRIRNSFDLAKKDGIDFSFDTCDLGENFHPNSVKILLTYDDHEEFVIGSSIGGGNILIVNIDGVDVSFDGSFPTLLFKYDEQKGIVASVSSLLLKNDYNIESINTTKDEINDEVTLTVELNDKLKADIEDELMSDKRFKFAKYVEV